VHRESRPRYPQRSSSSARRLLKCEERAVFGCPWFISFDRCAKPRPSRLFGPFFLQLEDGCACTRWPSPTAGGCGSVWVRGRADGAGHTWPAPRRDAALRVQQNTRQGREGAALPKPSIDQSKKKGRDDGTMLSCAVNGPSQEPGPFFGRRTGTTADGVTNGKLPAAFNPGRRRAGIARYSPGDAASTPWQGRHCVA
jgi:hypothetical protein